MGGPQRSRPGFTTVETLVALVISLTILGVVIGFLRFAWISFQRSEERLEPRERAHIALTTIRLALSDAWYYHLGDGGKSLSFETPKKQGEVRFDEAGGRLMYTAPGASEPRPLVSSRVRSFHIEVLRPGFLRLVLEIGRPERAGKLATLAPLRVMEELLIPAIALRDPSAAWIRALEPARAMEASL